MQLKLIFVFALLLNCLLPTALFSCTLPNEIIQQEKLLADSLPLTIKANYSLVWNDEFNGATVDLKKWNYRAEGTLRDYGIVSRQTISLNGNGQVSIKVTKDSNGNYFIGELGTQGLFETTYGYFECRAKMNVQLGPHVSFWLQSPTNNGSVLDPIVAGTEVDIFEYHRKTPDIVYHNLHWNGYETYHQTTGTKIYNSSVKTGYHVFGLEWTRDEYIFYVDGIETWRTTTAVSQRSEYLILSTELTGWGGDPALGNFPDEVLFDYVRVYKKILTNVSEVTNIVYAVGNSEIKISGEISKNTTANLYDLQGKIRLTKILNVEDLNIISTSNIEKGIYFLIIQNEQKLKNFKIIIT